MKQKTRKQKKQRKTIKKRYNKRRKTIKKKYNKQRKTIKKKHVKRGGAAAAADEANNWYEFKWQKEKDDRRAKRKRLYGPMQKFMYGESIYDMIMSGKLNEKVRDLMNRSVDLKQKLILLDHIYSELIVDDDIQPILSDIRLNVLLPSGPRPRLYSVTTPTHGLATAPLSNQAIGKDFDLYCVMDVCMPEPEAPTVDHKIIYILKSKNLNPDYVIPITMSGVEGKIDMKIWVENKGSLKAKVNGLTLKPNVCGINMVIDISADFVKDEKVKEFLKRLETPANYVP